MSNQIIIKSNHARNWSNHQIKSSNQIVCPPLGPTRGDQGPAHPAHQCSVIIVANKNIYNIYNYHSR